jgi:hypothetical protein
MNSVPSSRRTSTAESTRICLDSSRENSPKLSEKITDCCVIFVIEVVVDVIGDDTTNE